jgi:hypothetical protein
VRILGDVSDVCCRDYLVDVPGLREVEDVSLLHYVDPQEVEVI